MAQAESGTRGHAAAQPRQDQPAAGHRIDWQPLTAALEAGATREQVLAAAGALLGLDGPAESLAQLTSQDQVQAVADSLTAAPDTDDAEEDQ